MVAMKLFGTATKLCCVDSEPSDVFMNRSGVFLINSCKMAHKELPTAIHEYNTRLTMYTTQYSDSDWDEQNMLIESIIAQITSKTVFTNSLIKVYCCSLYIHTVGPPYMQYELM